MDKSSQPKIEQLIVRRFYARSRAKRWIKGRQWWGRAESEHWGGDTVPDSYVAVANRSYVGSVWHEPEPDGAPIFWILDAGSERPVPR